MSFFIRVGKKIRVGLGGIGGGGRGVGWQGGVSFFPCLLLLIALECQFGFFVRFFLPEISVISKKISIIVTLDAQIIFLSNCIQVLIIQFNIFLTVVVLC